MPEIKKTGNHKEDIDADVTAGCEHRKGVIEDDGNHSQRTQPGNIGTPKMLGRLVIMFCYFRAHNGSGQGLFFLRCGRRRTPS